MEPFVSYERIWQIENNPIVLRFVGGNHYTPILPVIFFYVVSFLFPSKADRVPLDNRGSEILDMWRRDEYQNWPILPSATDQQQDHGENADHEMIDQTIDSDAVRDIVERYQGPVRVVLESQLFNKNIRPDIVATAVDLQYQPVGQQSIQLHQQMGAAVRNDLSGIRQHSFPGLVEITSRGVYPYTRSCTLFISVFNYFFPPLDIAHYVIPPHLPADTNESRSFCRKLIYNILYDSQARRESSLVYTYILSHIHLFSSARPSFFHLPNL